MNTQEKKLDLIRAILAIEDSYFLHRIADFIKKEKPDFWHELSPEEQDRIEKGIKDLEKGQKEELGQILKEEEKK